MTHYVVKVINQQKLCFFQYKVFKVPLIDVQQNKKN